MVLGYEIWSLLTPNAFIDITELLDRKLEAIAQYESQLRTVDYIAFASGLAKVRAFHLPVNVGDLVSCYAAVTRVGRSSMTVKIDAWVQRRIGRHMERVTSGHFTYVAVDEKGKPRQVPPESGER